jgi:hypothetical protein
VGKFAKMGGGGGDFRLQGIGKKMVLKKRFFIKKYR